MLCVSGFGKTSSRDDAARYDVPEASVGQIVEITARDIVTPDMPGKFMSYYRFVGPDGYVSECKASLVI